MSKPISIYVLRHGVAVEKGAPGYKDAERPLTLKGTKEVKKVAKNLKRGGFEPDHILSSPFLRAAKTAEIAAEILKKEKKFRYSMHLIPTAKFTALFKELKKIAAKKRKILLVGHEPHLSGFVSYLISGDSKSRLALKKAGMCKVSFETSVFSPGRGQLSWLLTPSQLIRCNG